MTEAATRHILWHEFEEHFQQIRAGKVPVPNLERVRVFNEGREATTEEALGRIVQCPLGYKIHSGLANLPEGRFNALYFLTSTQGGHFDGQGYLIAGTWKEASVWSFAICKHQPVAGRNANPMRGWHPAKCSICGLDMSVDSGD